MRQAKLSDIDGSQNHYQNSLGYVEDELRVGTILVDTGRCILANFFSLFLFMSIYMIPILILIFLPTDFYMLMPDSWFDSEGDFIVPLLLVYLLIVLCFGVVGTIAVLVKTEAIIDGRECQLSDAFAAIYQHLFPIIGISILLILAMAISTLLLLIPFFMVICSTYVVFFARVSEGRSVLQSIERSVELTREYRWQIFGIYLVINIISSIFDWVLSLFQQVLGTEILTIVELLTTNINLLFTLVSAGIIFHTLRYVKEGHNTKDIETVFE
jgi:hypothetical protein